MIILLFELYLEFLLIIVHTKNYLSLYLILFVRYYNRAGIRRVFNFPNFRQTKYAYLIKYVLYWTECDPCHKPGHVCDPDTGRCVCPTLTEGGECQTCVSGSWNYNRLKGCKVFMILSFPFVLFLFFFVVVNCVFAVWGDRY